MKYFDVHSLPSAESRGAVLVSGERMCTNTG